MEIRPAGPDDAGAVDGIVQRAYAHYVDRIGRRPGPMDANYVEKVERGDVSLAVEADQVIGFIVLIEEEPDSLLIENVAVEPARQSQGIGRALLAFAEDVAEEAGLTELRLYTHVAMTENLAFYPRLGYTEVDRRTDHGFERVFFAKRIARPPSPRARAARKSRRRRPR